MSIDIPFHNCFMYGIGEFVPMLGWTVRRLTAYTLASDWVVLQVIKSRPYVTASSSWNDHRMSFPHQSPVHNLA